MAIDWDRIDVWVFDLDNTLYHPRHRLFDQIDRRMERYIGTLIGCDAAEARTIQKRYFHDHGTTLAGLMRHHGADPHDYLAYVHDVDLAALAPEAGFAEAIAALPGRRVIFTNADSKHADRVLARLGLSALFDGMHDVVACNFTPKPDRAAYEGLCEHHGINPMRAAMVEDMARNLTAAKAMGMTTIWVDHGSEAANRDIDPDCIDVRVDALLPWLQGVARQLQQERA